MNFLTVFVQSISDTQSYRRFLGLSPRFAFAYWSTFNLLVALGLTISLNQNPIPQFYQFFASAIGDALTQYPSNLNLTINQGQLTLPTDFNPIKLPLSQPTTDLNYLLTIDAHQVGEDLPQTHSLILLTPKSLAYRFDPFNPDSTTVIPWEHLNPDITLNSAAVIQELSHFQTYLNQLYIYRYPASLILIFIGLTFSRLIFLAVNSLFLLLFGRLNQRLITYRHVFRLSLYTSVIAGTVEIITHFLYQNLTVPIYSLTYIAVSLLAILSLPKINQINFPSSNA